MGEILSKISKYYEIKSLIIKLLEPPNWFTLINDCTLKPNEHYFSINILPISLISKTKFKKTKQILAKKHKHIKFKGETF